MLISRVVPEEVIDPVISTTKSRSSYFWIERLNLYLSKVNRSF